MLAFTFRNFCLSEKLLREPLNLTRKLCWKGQQEDSSGNFSKTIPKLVYLYNPLTYLWNQFQLSRIRLLWDREFQRNEFYRGTKQAAAVMTDCIREQDHLAIRNFTTPAGYQQITHDMILSKNDPRLQLVRFRFEDIQCAIPTKVALFKRRSNKNCFIDMMFVGMRNSKDFQNLELQLIEKTLRQLESQQKIRPNLKNSRHRILFAEMYIRFFRNYTSRVPADWSVSFYKIVSFDVLNYLKKK